MAQQQVNLRLDPTVLGEDALDRIDDRAARTGHSRNAWLNAVVKWALEQPVTERTTSVQRTERV